MSPDDRVHYYHADAGAFGGFLERPFEKILPVQASVSLPNVGGFGSVSVGEYREDGLISFKSASARVAGSVSKKNRAWTTIATATIEGLNIGEVLTADRIVSQVSTEHPLEGYQPKVSFLGSRFENLRIGGCAVDPVLNLDLCAHVPETANGYPRTSCLRDKGFMEEVRAQYAKMCDADTIPSWASAKQVPDWVRARYQWDNSNTSKGFVLCSLIQQVRGQFPGTPFGHVFEVPGFGRLALAELLLDDNSYQLTMIRMELGCPVQGSGGIGYSRTNGSTSP